MVGIAGRLKVRGVTGVAIRRHRLEAADGAPLVACIAIHSRVCARQRKTIVVLLQLLNRNLPSANGMALLAISSQLALVDVGMAVLTALSNIGKNRPDVTLSAADAGVHAPQGIFGLVVFEFRNGADGSPGIGSVAVLAGYV